MIPKGHLNAIAARVFERYAMRQLYRLRDQANARGKHLEAARWQRMIKEATRK